MKSKLLKILIFLVEAVFVMAVFITMLTAFCKLVLAPRWSDIAGMVRGFGFLLIFMAGDSVVSRFIGKRDLPRYLRWVFDIVIFAAGLALAYVILTFTPLRWLM